MFFYYKFLIRLFYSYCANFWAAVHGHTSCRERDNEEQGSIKSIVRGFMCGITVRKPPDQAPNLGATCGALGTFG